MITRISTDKIRAKAEKNFDQIWALAKLKISLTNKQNRYEKLLETPEKPFLTL